MVNLKLKPPHRGQRVVLKEADRFNVLACGRRWGKTDMGVEYLAIPKMLEAQPVGWFAPSYKLLEEAWEFMMRTLRPFGAHMQANKQERIIRIPGGGSCAFWTLSNTTEGKSSAGRGRKYARAVIDEAAHARYLEADWTLAIRPTLSDLQGDAWFPSTPRGHNYFHKLWCKGENGVKGWRSWRMPTFSKLR